MTFSLKESVEIINDPFFPIVNGMTGVVIGFHTFKGNDYPVVQADNVGPWMKSISGDLKKVRAWQIGNTRIAHPESLKKLSTPPI